MAATVAFNEVGAKLASFAMVSPVLKMPTSPTTTVVTLGCTSRFRGISLLTNASRHDCFQSHHVHMRLGVAIGSVEL